MRLSAPECSVTTELPSGVSWRLLSVDGSGVLWGVAGPAAGVITSDRGVGRRYLHRFDRAAVQKMQGLRAEDSPTPSPRPIMEWDPASDGEALRMEHSSSAPWTWLLTACGVVYLVSSGDDDTQSTRDQRDGIQAQHRLGAPITASTVIDRNLFVSIETETLGVSEVVALTYESDLHKIRMRAKALFRLGDRVEFLCVWRSPAATTSNDVADSILHEESDLGRTLLFTVTRQGNVDVWDLSNHSDATEEFGAPNYNAAALGFPACSVCVEGTLWIGTTCGAVIVFDMRSPTSPMEPIVLKHHKHTIRSMVAMSLGRRVWTCCADGTVAVWSTTRRKPYGVFAMQEVPVALLTTSPRQLLTHVWGIDENGGGRCWEVREQVAGLDKVATGTTFIGGGGAVVERRLDDAYHYMAHLCSLLTGREVVAPIVPAALDAQLPEARFLGDALVSLAECRSMIGEVFVELGWEPVSLSEDVRTLTRHARSSTHSAQRATEVARRLSELTPSFPVPAALGPVDQLLMAAECVLEEVGDTGVLRHPHFVENSQTAGTTPPKKPSKQQVSLDDSLVPVAEVLNEHIFETQLGALQDQLNLERKHSESLRRRNEDLEVENEQLQRAVAQLNEDRANAAAEVEKMRKSSLIAKKRLSVAENQLAHETAVLTESLKASQDEAAALRKQIAAAKDPDNHAHRLQEAELLVDEVLELLRETNAKYDHVKQAALATSDMLEAEAQRFQARERSGRTLIATLQGARDEARDLVEALRQFIDQTCARSSARLPMMIDAAQVQARLAPIERLLATQSPLPQRLQPQQIQNSQQEHYHAPRRLAL